MQSKQFHFAWAIAAILTVPVLTTSCGTPEVSKVAETLLTSERKESFPPSSDHKVLPKNNIQKPEKHVTRPDDLASQRKPSLDFLFGLTPKKIRTLLGSPHFQRFDHPAEIWQYRQRNCILYLFLYPSSVGLSVSHLEIRNHSYDKINHEKCFAKFIRTAHRKSG